MKKLFCVLAGISVLGVLAGTYSIIPQPECVEAKDGEFVIQSLKLFVENADSRSNLSEMVALKLGTPTGWQVQSVPCAEAEFRFLNDPSLRKDAYTLVIDASGVTARAG